MKHQANVCSADHKFSLIQLLDKVEQIVSMVPLLKQFQRKQLFEEDRVDKVLQRMERFLTQVNVDMEFNRL